MTVEGGGSCSPAFFVTMSAHNEEWQIGPCIGRVMGTGYPPDHFSVFVIADNCTDDTLAQASEENEEHPEVRP